MSSVSELRPLGGQGKSLVSVVIPCRNECAHIRGFLESLLTQDFPRELYEIIVADGMSDDGTREALEAFRERYPGIQIIENKSRTVSPGLNAAIREATGDIIVRMDVHTEYAPDYISQCVTTLNNTGADNVGGPARTKAKGYIQGAIRVAYHAPFSVGGARFHDTAYEGYVDTVTYGCWKKSTLEKIGLFDEELVRNQDDELNLRLVRSGGKIWQTPKIRSWYYPRDSLSGLFRQYMQYGYWKVRVIQKHKLPASVRHLIPGAFVALLLLLVLLSPLSATSFLILGWMTSLYFIANICASLHACRSRAALKCLPVMPFVFGVYHFGYGYGFLRGMFDFLVRRKMGDGCFTKVTRNKV